MKDQNNNLLLNDKLSPRTYSRENSVVFLKTKEAFGGLSNMAGGFPLCVNNINILTSEALYQVCRFPHLPDVQKIIIEQKSQMAAKMKSKPYRSNSRADWDNVRVKIMRWCLHVKLAQNYHFSGELLLSTDDMSIVEESRKDPFWGAKITDSGDFFGINILGRLLVELREEYRNDELKALLIVEPLQIEDFLIYGEPIEVVSGNLEDKKAMLRSEKSDVKKQTSLFG